MKAKKYKDIARDKKRDIKKVMQEFVRKLQDQFDAEELKNKKEKSKEKWRND